MNKKFKKTLLAIVLGAVIGLALTGGILGIKMYLHGKLPGGTVIANLDLGYMELEEASKALEQKEVKYANTPQVITAGEVSAEFTPADLGVQTQALETLKTLDRIDFKERSFPYELSRRLEANSREILYTFDPEILLTSLEKKLNLSDIAPKNAQFIIDPKKGLTIIEESAGLVPNIDQLIQDIKVSAGLLEPTILTLELTEEQPTVLQEELKLVEEDISRKLAQSIKVTKDDFKWTFSVTKYIDWVSFEEVVKTRLPNTRLNIELQTDEVPSEFAQQHKQIRITLDREKVDAYLDEQYVEYLEEEVDPVSIYQDEENQIVIDGKGRDGIKIKRSEFKRSLELAINEEIPKIEVTTKTLKAPVTIATELQDLGIKEMIGQGHTSFYGSPANRVHNINVGMERFNGTLIAPDEEFSFNTQLGAVDYSTGYRKELVITPKGTIPEYGGGLCQVSTTTYRAALYSGLPITDRRPHSYAVSYYSQIVGHGLDATIYLGGQDLKFTNDTPGHILIQAYADSYHAHFKFYGTSDERQVELEGPELSNYKYSSTAVVEVESSELAPGEKKQVGTRHTGFDALWKRIITRPGEEPVEEEIFSHYKATQNKFMVGTE
jgi:vancomycin resistance protein YoaR